MSLKTQIDELGGQVTSLSELVTSKDEEIAALKSEIADASEAATIEIAGLKAEAERVAEEYKVACDAGSERITALETELAESVAAVDVATEEAKKAQHAMANPAYADAGARGVDEAVDLGAEGDAEVEEQVSHLDEYEALSADDSKTAEATTYFATWQKEINAENQARIASEGEQV